MTRIFFSALAAAACLYGCASPGEHVLFVTKTSLGIDLDGAPASASIAYDRTEGYLGPRFENGAVPPVVAKISSNGQILGRDIKQYYATGTAANKLTGNDLKASKPGLEGDAKPMFFGTSTTLGIKIGFTTTVPDSFVLGYRRKELSLIPIGTTIVLAEDGKTEIKQRSYPSVIGVFSSDYSAKTPVDSGFGVAQFFATGTAAESLADSAPLQSEFRKFAIDAVAEFKDATRAQQATALSLLDCFTSMPDAKLDAALDNAKDLDLYGDRAGDPKTYKAIKTTAASDKQKARAQYVAVMSTVDTGDKDRSGRLEGHRVYVCGLK